jgi:hypothetical protein
LFLIIQPSKLALHVAAGALLLLASSYVACGLVDESFVIRSVEALAIISCLAAALLARAAAYLGV